MSGRHSVRNLFQPLKRAPARRNSIKLPSVAQPFLTESAAYRKKKIPSAVRQQVWLHYIGEKYKTKCQIKWCKNEITVWTFVCGHNVPESKGGSTTLDNLRPICNNCNLSMGDQFTIDEWTTKFAPPKKSSFWSYCVGKTSAVEPNGR